jgi:uncharacterized protein
VDGRVLPADQFVLKVHSRCDLACDHCYVYESADQSWRGRPPAISRDVASRAALRIAEHAKTHELSRVEVVLHGGEPLLAGVAGLRATLLELESALSGICRLDVKVHTNGVLLTEKFCDLFDAHDVGVGVSLDGDRASNDRHRRYRDGRSSYDAAVRAIRLLASRRYQHLYSGVLCTIDVENDPVTVYESLLELRPPRIDFLLPHATHDSPPARPAGTGTEYADWLTAIFDRWQADGYPVRIRTFDSITATLAGRDSGTEALGLAPVRLVVIETDGSYEQADSLKVAYDGAPATGLDVFTHSLDAVLEHPGVVGRQQGIADLSATCQRCPVVTSCGGGMYAHRYKPGTGFDNPSVYCADLLKLINHLRNGLPHVRPLRNAALGLSERALGDLGRGPGDVDAIGQLARAQRLLRRGHIAALYEEAMSAPAVSAQAREQLNEAWQALAAVEGSSPSAVDAVLGHPYLGTWSQRCLQGLVGGTGDQGPDLAHFGAIAAAAAVRGAIRARCTVPLIADAVHLPGLGRLVPGVTGAERAVLEVDADWVVARLGAACWRLPAPALLAGEPCLAVPGAPDGTAGGSPPGRWEPVRLLTAPGIRVALDDVDPYRHFPHRASARLPEADLVRWRERFALAWAEIAAHHEAYATALAAGLSTVTPLASPSHGAPVSGTTRPAFGVAGIELPDDPVSLALLLIRSLQRMKLGAILAMHEFFRPAVERRGRTSREAGHEPLERLLGDAYADLAACAFWRARAALGGTDREIARQGYQRGHERAAEAIATLAGSGSLMPLGTEFIGQMLARLKAMPL